MYSRYPNRIHANAYLESWGSVRSKAIPDNTVLQYYWYRTVLTMLISKVVTSLFDRVSQIYRGEGGGGEKVRVPQHEVWVSKRLEEGGMGVSR